MFEVAIESLTLLERRAIDIIKEAFISNNISFDAVKIEQRSSDYITLVCHSVIFNNGEYDSDFCRVKAGPKSTWVSLDVWGCGNIKNDYRFNPVKKRNIRHWKIELNDVECIKDVTDLIIAVFMYNTAPNNYTFSPIIKSEIPNDAIFMKPKGKSLLEFPTSYIVFDIETTGLSSNWDEIIEISAIKIVNGEQYAEFNTLVKPKEAISDFISELTGITNDMVIDAPLIENVLPEFYDFVGDAILVGHNINFDIDFINCAGLKHNIGKILSNFYVDTLKISKRLLPGLDHHRLKDITNALGIDYQNAHRAHNDCVFTYQCLEKMREIDKENPELLTLEPPKHKARHFVKSADISTQNTEFDEDSPIYGKVVIITGALKLMTRAEAMQVIVDLGGINGDTVTKKTDYLVIGNNDYCNSIKDGKSTKQKKAEQYILKGCDIKIIPEDMFYEMITKKEEG